MNDYQPPPAEWTLPRDEAHVWRLSTAVDAASIERLQVDLSDDERRRVDRFHFEPDRRRAIVARASLRRLLGRCLNVAPNALVFENGPRGKPALGESQRRGLSFNLAHSHEMVLLAVAWGQEVGVDVEFVRPMVDAGAIVRSHFTPAEARMLETSAEGSESAFFRLWTRKEAIMKGVGSGLAMPLNQFDASSQAPADGEWLAVTVSSHAPSSWVLRDLPSAENYRAALALERTPSALRLWSGLPCGDSY